MFLYLPDWYVASGCKYTSVIVLVQTASSCVNQRGEVVSKYSAGPLLSTVFLLEECWSWQVTVGKVRHVKAEPGEGGRMELASKSQCVGESCMLPPLQVQSTVPAFNLCSAIFTLLTFSQYTLTLFLKEVRCETENVWCKRKEKNSTIHKSLVSLIYIHTHFSFWTALNTTSLCSESVHVKVNSASWGYICASGHSCSRLVQVGPLPSESPLIKPASPMPPSSPQSP